MLIFLFYIFSSVFSVFSSFVRISFCVEEWTKWLIV
jgi:hypothetical protein